MEKIRIEFKHEPNSLKRELLLQMITYPASIALWWIISLVIARLRFSGMLSESGMNLPDISLQFIQILGLTLLVLTLFYTVIVIWAYNASPYYNEAMQLSVDQDLFELTGSSFRREKRITEFNKIKIKRKWVKFYFNPIEAYIIPRDEFSKEEVRVIEELSKALR